ncbi:MAG: sodium:proton antiporter [Candidatus Improbicoccus devescovinae]|nr:MAG: sodium:proton antiporter [Candidatus Improbicoccus devescovinae]
MEALNLGIWSILPPIVSIFLAIITKEVVFSLFTGISLGVTIYCVASKLSLVAIVKIIFNLISTSIGSNVLVLMSTFLMGSFSKVIINSGGTCAYIEWIEKKIKSRRLIQLFGVFLALVFAIDDYLSILTLGTIMRPVIKKHNISREKLAYLLDTSAAPMCVLTPISSWAAVIVSCLAATGLNGVEIFVRTIPYNFYAILTLVFMVIVIIKQKDFGKMNFFEQNAKSGEVKFNANIIEKNSEQENMKKNSKISDLLVPILCMIITSILMICETGGFFQNHNLNIMEILGNANFSISIITGVFLGLIAALILTLIHKTLTFKEFMESINDGIKSMAPTSLVLGLAWSMTNICKSMLMTDSYISSLILASKFPSWIFPCILFLTAAVLSFSIGSAWGTFGILIPVAVAICSKNSLEILVITLAAVLSGSVWGDHCSPISDTTILSSTGAECVHMNHVLTQLPYVGFIGLISCIGYILLGVTHNFLVSFILCVILIYLIFNILVKRKIKIIC